jgi:hypothetical protein
MTTTTLTYQHQRQPEKWLYEIKQKGNSQTCYVMVQNVKVSPMMTFPRLFLSEMLPPVWIAKVVSLKFGT